ncbi:MAG: hypothetical protein AAGB32_03615 [Pseudomonadota bacterium]
MSIMDHRSFELPVTLLPNPSSQPLALGARKAKRPVDIVTDMLGMAFLRADLQLPQEPPAEIDPKDVVQTKFLPIYVRPEDDWF